MDRYRGREEGVGRKAFYGGRVEFYPRDRVPGAIRFGYGLSALFAAECAALLGFGFPWLSAINGVCAGAMLWRVIVTHRAWRKRQREKTHYYDVMSSYPKAMLEPVRKGKRK